VLKRFSLGFASLLWAAMALLAGPSETPERWRVLYFYDDLKTSLVINDFKFLDPKHGVAAGFLFDQKGKINPKAMLSDDGGVHWTFVALKETPLSLFFLNENHGWIVGERFIWQSADGGRTWNKLSELDGAVRVYFIDDEHGWAVGEEKSVWETDNGGKAWKEVPAAAAPRQHRLRLRPQGIRSASLPPVRIAPFAGVQVIVGRRPPGGVALWQRG